VAVGRLTAELNVTVVQATCGPEPDTGPKF
jgi:hypothetical protein